MSDSPDNHGDNAELIREFLVESHESLDHLERDVVALERDPRARQAVDRIFRTLHTIKGTCGFVGFSRLERVAHAGEGVLSRLRDGELDATAEITSALLATGDAIRGMLRRIEAAGAEGSDDHEPLVTRLLAFHGDAVAGPAPQRETKPTPPSNVDESPPPVVPAPPAAVAPPPPPAVAAPPPAVEPPAPEHPTVADAQVRVNVRLLDALMNLVGELVLVRNQMLELVPGFANSSFTATSQRLSLITTSMQGEVMKTRMQPVRNVWDKFPRIVRDLAVTCGKQARLEMEGQDTELDRTIIEAIKDPLTHLLRNCLDHGIEPAAARVAAGKNPEGRLHLRAFHEGGQVVIEMSDDGAGLDVERIRAKALERGLIPADEAGRMSERDLVNLIFLPGFSTAATVSAVSGRGVGMDVVKTNIERIGGSVDLQTRRGQGTTFRIKIPLTLAIVPALIVGSAGDRYAIPQVSMSELVRLEGEQAERGIELIHGTPVYRLRGQLLPLLRLDRELGVAGGQGQTLNIVVLQAEERRFGLVVDSINDTQEIVVKPLGTHLKGLGVFAGATIMGDGRVALILDVVGLARRAGLAEEVAERLAAHHDAGAAAAEARRSWLLCRGGDGRRLALPLDLVSRLESFPREKLRRMGGGLVVPYRGEILPLLEANDGLGFGGAAAPDESESVHVVVHERGGQRVGLVVGRILDVVDDVDRAAAARGGCAMIEQEVTELVDVPGLLRRAVFDGVGGLS